MHRLFLDTSFAIALASRQDTLHERAVALSEEIIADHPRMVTTQAVLVEIGNALSAPPLRAATARYIDGLKRDLTVEVIPTTEDLFQRACGSIKSAKIKAGA